MKYLKSINESIAIGKVGQTIRWIKEKIGHDDLIDVFDEVKTHLDDEFDLKWAASYILAKPGVSVYIDYSYKLGKRIFKNTFYIPKSDLSETKGSVDHINKFMGRLESATKISVVAEEAFTFKTNQIEDSLKNLRSEYLDTIESVENVKIAFMSSIINTEKAKHPAGMNLTFNEFKDEIEIGGIEPKYYHRLRVIKDLPINFLSVSDDGTDPIEKLPQSIIKDFVEFVNKVKLTKADRKELIDIIERGYGKGKQQ